MRRFQQVFYVAEDRLAVLDRLLALLDAHLGAGRQVYDTNIVATMLEHGIRRLLTFNAGDFRRFAGIIELEPTQSLSDNLLPYSQLVDRSMRGPGFGFTRAGHRQ